MTEIKKFEQAERFAPSADLYPGGISGPSYMRPVGGWMDDWNGKRLGKEYVSASDYDALLALARKQAEEQEEIARLKNRLPSQVESGTVKEAS